MLALPLIHSGNALAQDASGGRVEIEKVISNGSGCPAGTAQATIANDKQSLHVVYGQFAAMAGPGIPLPRSRSNCIVNISAKVTDGFTWAVAEVDFRGVSQIADGGSGVHRTTYFFQGQAQQLVTTHSFSPGPQRPWADKDEFDASNALFAPCNAQRSLNIDTSLRVTPSTAPGSPGSSLRMRQEQVVRLLVKRCPGVAMVSEY
jgi:hypothetical protein